MPGPDDRISPTGQRFGRAQRVSLDRDYQSAFRARLRKSAGPLTLFARPNETGRSRLGLSIGRRVGGAVVRNRLKRMLREAFRLSAAELPSGYDLVVTARAHEPMPLARYRSLLIDLATKASAEHESRLTKRGES